jgi:succinate-acetate transporter protein
MDDNTQMQWADPNPAGNFLVSCILIGTGALFAGLVPSACLPMLLVNSIVVGVTLLMLAVISFKKGDIMGGTLNAVFATIFAIGSSLAGLAQFVLPFFLGVVAKGPVTLPIAQIPAHINGWVLLPGAVTMLAMAFIAMRLTWLLAVWFGLFSVTLGLASVWMLMGTPGITDPSLPIQNHLINTSGWLFIACGISMFYIGLANFINALAGKMVMPMGSPLVKTPVQPDAKKL